MSTKKELLMAAANRSMEHMDKKTLGDKKYIQDIAIDKLKENPFQPRLDMDDSKIDELMASIDKNGLLQPVVLNKSFDGSYTIVAGHRRVESTKRLGKKYIKAIVYENLKNQELATMALIENIQREDLDYIELSIQYNNLLTANIFNSIKELAAAIGKHESDVSKTIKLCGLSDYIIEDIKMTKSIKDLKILDALRKIESIDLQEELYQWYIEELPSRTEFLVKAKSLYSKNSNLSSFSNEKFLIKNNKKSCSIQMPPLDNEKLEKLEKFIKTLL